MVEQLFPTEMLLADLGAAWSCRFFHFTTHPQISVVPSELYKAKEATGDAVRWTSFVAECMVWMRVCDAEETSYVDGKVVHLSANASLKKNNITWGY